MSEIYNLSNIIVECGVRLGVYASKSRVIKQVVTNKEKPDEVKKTSRNS